MPSSMEFSRFAILQYCNFLRFLSLPFYFFGQIQLWNVKIFLTKSFMGKISEQVYPYSFFEINTEQKLRYIPEAYIPSKILQERL